MNKKSICALVSLACITAGAATNYDLLGRKASQMNSPMVYKDVKNVKQKAISGKSLQRDASDPFPTNAYGVTSVVGAFDEDNVLAPAIYTKVMDVYSNGLIAQCSDATGALYLKCSNQFYGPLYASSSDRKEAATSKYTTNTSYSTTFSTIYSYNALPPSYDANGSQTYRNISSVRNYLGYPGASGFPSNSNYSNVGIYVTTKAKPSRLGSKDPQTYYYSKPAIFNNVNDSRAPSPANEYTASILNAAMKALPYKATTIIQNTTSAGALFENPSKHYPHVYVGLHAENLSSSGTTTYGAPARDLDTYIYNNHTIEIVAAGNNGKQGSKLISAAHAVNAITVGSVDFQGYTEEISSTNNQSFGVQKPEVMNYSNYYPDNADISSNCSGSNCLAKKTYSNGKSFYPVLDGTAGAAALTASMVADLLQKRPHLRWHPEIVKARLLTASERPIQGSNPGNAMGIPTYTALLGNGQNYNNYSRFWNGYVDEIFEIADFNAHTSPTPRRATFYIKVEKGHAYRAAISWLSHGDDIKDASKNVNRLPQEFQLTVKMDDGSSISNRFKKHGNNYEEFNFIADKTGIAYIEVRYCHDYVEKDNPRYGYIQLGFNLLHIAQ